MQRWIGCSVEWTHCREHLLFTRSRISPQLNHEFRFHVHVLRELWIHESSTWFHFCSENLENGQAKEKPVRLWASESLTTAKIHTKSRPRSTNWGDAIVLWRRTLWKYLLFLLAFYSFAHFFRPFLCSSSKLEIILRSQIPSTQLSFEFQLAFKLNRVRKLQHTPQAGHSREDIDPVFLHAASPCTSRTWSRSQKCVWSITPIRNGGYNWSHEKADEWVQSIVLTCSTYNGVLLSCSPALSGECLEGIMGAMLKCNLLQKHRAFIVVSAGLLRIKLINW